MTTTAFTQTTCPDCGSHDSGTRPGRPGSGIDSVTYCNGCARVHTMTSAPVAWTVTAFHNRGGRSATDYTTKKAALALFVEYVKAGITVELRSPAGHCHNAYRAETGDVLVEADGSYRLP